MHPAARCLVDISKSQDAEIGDGTTFVASWPAPFKIGRPLIEEGVHPRLIVRANKEALCVERIHAVKLKEKPDRIQHMRMLVATAMNSKLIALCKEQFADIVMRAVSALKRNNCPDLAMLSIKKVLDGVLQESQLVEGVAFQKTFTFAGYEQQKKHISNSYIMLLNLKLEWSAEKEKAEIRLDDPEKFKTIIEAEYSIIYGKLDRSKALGANVALSNKSIGTWRPSTSPTAASSRSVAFHKRT